MKIIRLSAENVKRLVAVEIEPTGNLVEITGKNGAGKTSVLDSIWWALAGTRTHQDRPIRDGETEARIEVDMGELIVQRQFKETFDGRVTTALTVEAVDEDGVLSKLSSPQKVIDGLLGTLAFDPLEFRGLGTVEQYRRLTELCGLDLDEMDRDQKLDYDRRTDLNRQAKERDAAAKQIKVPADTPAEPLSVAGLTEELSDAHLHNQKVLQQSTKADLLGSEVERHAEGAMALEVQSNDMLLKAEQLRALAKDKQEEYDRIVEAGEMAIPVEDIQEQLANAEGINRAIEARERRRNLLVDSREATKKAKVLSSAMEKRTLDMKTMVEAADLPVEGITLEGGSVYYDGVPFNQASDAEQLRVSCAIAMRENAKLRVIRVRDGSLLDDDSLQALAEMAEAEDFQVWIERVDSSGKVGFVIKDGMLIDGDPGEEA